MGPENCMTGPGSLSRAPPPWDFPGLPAEDEPDSSKVPTKIVIKSHTRAEETTSTVSSLQETSHHGIGRHIQQASLRATHRIVRHRYLRD